jgi:MFS transporter, DHA3 family, macrolide efflux protein
LQKQHKGEDMQAVEVKRKPRLTGMRAFTLIWIGQVVSLLGTAMSQFALTLWAWELTGSATALALVGLFSFAPVVLVSPIAGALVDRWDRKTMLSDLMAGLATVVIFLLNASGNLQIWHLYIAGAFAGIFQSFQFPAYSAAISTMLNKEQYARASGMMGLAESASGILAPPIAGALFVFIGLRGLLLIDIITFVFAISMLLLVFIPAPVVTEEGEKSRSGGFWREVSYGFTYIFQRPSLLGLQLVFFFINLTATFSFIVLAPMILSRTAEAGNGEIILGTVQSFAGIGGVVGSLLLSVWGGPKRRVHGVLLGMFASSLLGMFPLGFGLVPIFWMIGSFFSSFFIPILNGSNQAIWQAKVAPDIQGRVFSVRRLIAQITAPVAMLLAGPLADQVFEPAMMPGGSLSDVFGKLVGTGPGAGMALMFLISGVLGIIVSLGAYAFPAVRYAEDILPDHQQT